MQNPKKGCEPLGLIALLDLKAREAVFLDHFFDRMAKVRSEALLVSGVDQVVVLVLGDEASLRERGPLLLRHEEALLAFVQVVGQQSG